MHWTRFPSRIAAQRLLTGCLGLVLFANCGRQDHDPVERAARSISASRIAQHGRWLADDARAGRYYASPEADSIASDLRRRLRAFDIPLATSAAGLFAGRGACFVHSFSVTLFRIGPRTRLVASRGTDERTALLGRDALPVVFCRDAAVVGPVVRVDAVANANAALASTGLAGAIAIVDVPADGHDEAWLHRRASELEAQGASAVLFAADPNFLHGAATAYPSHLTPELQAAVRSERGSAANLQPDRLSQAAQAQAWLAAPHRILPAFVVRRSWAAGLHDGDLVALEVQLVPEVSLAQNILVGFRGRSRSNEVVLVGAHYDHAGVNATGDVLNGANDNASGVAALLEIAAALRSIPNGLERSVLVAFFSAEHEGLLGSEALRQDWDKMVGSARHPVAMLSLRALGGNATQPLVLVGGETYPELAAIVAGLDRADGPGSAALGVLSAPEESTRVARLEIVPSRGSDHLSFARRGVPSLLVTDGADPLEWGQPDDDWDRVDADKVARAARLVFRSVCTIANAPGANAAAANPGDRSTHR